MGSVDVPDPPCGRADCARLLASLATAIERRDVIGVAKGLIMAGSSCTVDEAFDVLVQASMHRNVKLHLVATEIVAARGV